MRALAALLRSCHPLPSAGVTAAAVLLAVAVGHTPARAALVGLAVLSGQLSIGWANDWIDRARDASAARSDKPVALGQVSAAAVRTAALVALAACVPLSLAVGLAPGLIHLVAVGFGWAYDLGLKATILSILPYAAAFGLLPLYVVAALPGHPVGPLWMPLAGACLGCAAHLVNVQPDREADLAAGVRAFPHRIGGRASAVFASGLLLAATAALALGPPGPPGPAAAGALVAALAGSAVTWRASARPGSRAAFVAIVVIAVVDVGLLVLGGSGLGDTLAAG